MTLDDVTFESVYAVPISDNAHQAMPAIDPQAERPVDVYAAFVDDGRGAAPERNFYGHESAPFTMNAMALEVEGVIMAQPSAWQWIPDTPIGHRGNTGMIIAQAPEIDPWTQPLMSEPREGYRGTFPYDRFTKIPFPNAWE